MNRKVKAYRGYARTAARIAMGLKLDAACRRQALELALMAVQLGNWQMARAAHDLIWAATGGLPNEKEFAAFEVCEMV